MRYRQKSKRFLSKMAQVFADREAPSTKVVLKHLIVNETMWFLAETILVDRINRIFDINYNKPT